MIIFGSIAALEETDKTKYGVETLAQEISRVTREFFIRQQVHNSLETGDFSKAVVTVNQFTGTTYIDNVRRNLLMFDYNNGSVGFIDFVLKVSKQKGEFLSNSNIDSNYFSEMKTMHLNVLQFHSLYSSFFFYLRVIRSLLLLQRLSKYKTTTETSRRRL